MSQYSDSFEAAGSAVHKGRYLLSLVRLSFPAQLTRSTDDSPVHFYAILSVYRSIATW